MEKLSINDDLLHTPYKLLGPVYECYKSLLMRFNAPNYKAYTQHRMLLICYPLTQPIASEIRNDGAGYSVWRKQNRTVYGNDC